MICRLLQVVKAKHRDVLEHVFSVLGTHWPLCGNSCTWGIGRVILRMDASKDVTGIKACQTYVCVRMKPIIPERLLKHFTHGSGRFATRKPEIGNPFRIEQLAWVVAHISHVLLGPWGIVFVIFLKRQHDVVPIVFFSFDVIQRSLAVSPEAAPTPIEVKRQFIIRPSRFECLKVSMAWSPRSNKICKPSSFDQRSCATSVEGLKYQTNPFRIPSAKSWCWFNPCMGACLHKHHFYVAWTRIFTTLQSKSISTLKKMYYYIILLSNTRQALTKKGVLHLSCVFLKDVLNKNDCLQLWLFKITSSLWSRSPPAFQYGLEIWAASKP